jgi:hypothetical protein
MILAAAVTAGAKDNAAAKRWTERFDLASCNWSATGRNDYFILEPGYQQVLDGHEKGAPVHLEITVLEETKKIGGVETRVVEERETHNGQLIEVSRNYFAVCKPTNDVFYFGEQIDFFKDGKVTGHEGSWVADRDGAKPGLFMPSRALLGSRFYQELAPGVALDRVEIAGDAESLNTPAGEFHDCVRTEETTPLEPGAKEYKTFAKGVGLVQDGAFLLTRYRHNAPPRQ